MRLREVGNCDFQSVCIRTDCYPSILQTNWMDELLITPDKIEFPVRIPSERRVGQETIRPETLASRALSLATSVDPRGRAAAAFAFFFFVVCSGLLYGPGIVAHPSSTYIGGGHDPAGYIWSMVWWPYAIVHGLNPFMPRVIWSPVGFNLAWAAAIPGPSLLLWPITRLFGPIVAFNLLMLLTPPIVALSTFLLCRTITGRFWASVVGGFLFGFSPYMIGHMLMGQPNLTLIFAVPLGLYLIVRRLDGSIGQRTFVILFAGTVTLQFLVSTEIVALTTLFGGIALIIALIILEREQNSSLRNIMAPLALAYVISGVLLLPYLYDALFLPMPEQMHPVEKCSADLLAYFVPSPMMLLGGGTFANYADTLTPHVWYGGKGVYTSPALLVIVALYTYIRWRTAIGKLLILSGAAVVVCSLGPRLHVADHSLMVLPWHWMMKIPTLNQALPVRFAMFLFLVISIMTAIVLSDTTIARSVRISLTFFSVLLLLPNRHYRLTVPQHVDTPAFFETSTIKTYVRPGDALLIFPYSIQGTTMLWQAQTNMYFNMVGGYISTYVPIDYRHWPVVTMMLHDEPQPHFASELKRFLEYYQVKGIVVADESATKWHDPLALLGIEPREVGGVLFYSVSPLSSSTEGTDATRGFSK
jgi:hypothetical protein